MKKKRLQPQWPNAATARPLAAVNELLISFLISFLIPSGINVKKNENHCRVNQINFEAEVFTNTGTGAEIACCFVSRHVVVGQSSAVNGLSFVSSVSCCVCIEETRVTWTNGEITTICTGRAGQQCIDHS